MSGVPTAIIIGSNPSYLVNFRRELILALVGRGYRVVTAAWGSDDAVAQILAGWGVARHEQLPIRQGSIHPGHEWRLFRALVSLLKSEKPELVLAYTAKPVVYSMIAARLVGSPRRVALVEGLGYAFIEGPGLRRRLTNILVRLAYGIALRCATKVVVLNDDDQRRIAAIAGVPVTAVGLLPGIGVSQSHFDILPTPAAPLHFLYVGRILIDKGLAELLEAARLLRVKGLDFRLSLVGPYDRNPAAFPRAAFDAAVEASGAEWAGHSDDVKGWLAGAHVLVLPSYREGFPRVAMEAMAVSRPVIVTDTPGCRDCVVPGQTGLLAPVRDAAGLANAMARFITEPALAVQMGQEAYAYAGAHFRAEARAEQLLDIIGLGDRAA